MLSIFRRALGGEPNDWDDLRGADIETESYAWNVMMRVWRTISSNEASRGRSLKV